MARTLSAAAVAIVMFAGPADAASEGSFAGVPVPLNGFADLLVDETRGRVLVTGGTGNSSVVVYGLDGSHRTTITGLPGAAGMVLTGSTLYVARQGGAAIDVLDAATLQKTDTLDLPTPTTGKLAYAGGRLWYLAGTCGSHPALASVHPTTEVVETTSSTFYCGTFATHATDPNLLLVGTTGVSPATIYRYDVSSTAAKVVEHRYPANSSNLRELAVTPAGSTVITASGAPYVHPEFRVSDLVATGLSYPTGHYPNAVDVAAAGWVAAGRDATYDSDVYVFPLGETTATWTWDFGEDNLAPAGLEITSDGSRVLAVTRDVYGDVYELHSIVVGTAGGGDADDGDTGGADEATEATVTKGKLLGGYGKSGKFRLYRRRERPLYRTRVAPPPGSGSVELVLEAASRRRWVEVDRKSFPLDADGRSVVKVRVPAGYRFRIAGSFQGDDGFARSRSRWSYFGLTR